jgi:uncharacterized protein YkwD
MPDSIFFDGSYRSGEWLLNLVEREFLRLLNVYRTAKGVPAVANIGGGALQTIAVWKSSDQGLHPELPISHTDSLGRSASQRWDIGYNLNTYKGEIIAFNYPTPNGVLHAWQNSPGHNTILLDPNYTVVGIAAVVDLNGFMQWTVEFGGMPLNQPTG